MAIGLVSPPLTEKAFHGLTEAVTEVLLVVAVWSFVRWRERAAPVWAVTCGVALGAAGLVATHLPGRRGCSSPPGSAVGCGAPGEPARALRATAALATGTAVLIGGLAGFNLVRFTIPAPHPSWAEPVHVDGVVRGRPS